MSSRVFIGKGHGYETGSRGRCVAFDDFTIIAAPLHQDGEGWKAAFGDEARASRVFGRQPNGNGGTDYGSHAIALARREGESKGALYLLMHHGGGREVLRIPPFYDGGALDAMILGMEERLQYALLYTLYKTACFARDAAVAETTEEWRSAVEEKRTRKRRGRRVEVVPREEMALR